MAYLEIGKGVCHDASAGRRHSRGASIIETGAACGTFIHGRRSHYRHYGQCLYKFMDVFLYPTSLRVKQPVDDRIVRTSSRSMPTRMRFYV